MKTVNGPEILVQDVCKALGVLLRDLPALLKFPLVLFSGCPSTASVCMIRKGTTKVNIVGVTNTQKMSVNGE